MSRPEKKRDGEIVYKLGLGMWNEHIERTNNYQGLVSVKTYGHEETPDETRRTKLFI